MDENSAEKEIRVLEIDTGKNSLLETSDCNHDLCGIKLVRDRLFVVQLPGGVPVERVHCLRKTRETYHVAHV